VNGTAAPAPQGADDTPRAPWLLLRAGALPALAAGLLVTAAGFTSGRAAVLGALAGTVLSVTALASGPLLLRAARNVRPAMLFALAVTTYTVVVGVLGVAYAVLGDVSQVNTTWLGGAIIAATLAWLAGQVRQTSRLRLLAFGDRVPPG
jgi:hypothetical protein